MLCTYRYGPVETTCCILCFTIYFLRIQDTGKLRRDGNTLVIWLWLECDFMWSKFKSSLCPCHVLSHKNYLFDRYVERTYCRISRKEVVSKVWFTKKEMYCANFVGSLTKKAYKNKLIY